MLARPLLRNHKDFAMVDYSIRGAHRSQPGVAPVYTARQHGAGYSPGNVQVATVAELRAGIVAQADTYLVLLNGAIVPFAWDPTSAAADDGQTCLQVTGVATGRYVEARVSTSVAPQGAYERMVHRIFSAAPLKILDFYCAENITDATTVATVPGVLPGGTALAHAGAAAGFSIKTNPINGRKCFYSTAAADRAVRRTTGVIKSCVIVYRHYGYRSEGGNFLCSISGGVYPFQIDTAADQWKVSGVGDPVHYVDGYQCNSLINDEQPHVLEGEMAANTTAGFRVGGFEGFNFSVQGEIYAIIPLTAVLTASERAEITAALMEFYAIRRPRGLFLDGNSLVTGHPTGYNWFRAVTPPNVVSWNIAVAGETLADVLAGMSAGIAAKDYANLRDCVYFLYEDVNSYYHGMTDAQVISYNWQIAAAARALGMKVILSTCMPADITLTPTADAYRVAANAIKRAQWRDHADALIDWAALAPFSDSTNSAVFTDHLHLTAYGYYLMGCEFRKVLSALQ